MQTYTFTVPPTWGMGSYKSACTGYPSETYQENALWDYNRARAHDGLPPLTDMPSGTVYTPIHQK